MSLEDMEEWYKHEHLKKFDVYNFYDRPKIKEKLKRSGFKLLDSKYILSSKISYILKKIHSKVGLSGVPLLLFFITYPISFFSEKLFSREDQGLVLGIKAARCDGQKLPQGC